MSAWLPTLLLGLAHREQTHGCRPGNPLLRKEWPIDCIPLLRGLPLLFIHGARDVIVGVEHSRRLYAAAAEPKRLEIVEGGGHAEGLFRARPAWFVGLVRSWLRSGPAEADQPGSPPVDTPA